MDDCVFCKIAEGKIKSDIVYSDENIVAFNDIDPKAPVHILVIPREHIEKIEETPDAGIFAEVFSAIKKIVDAKHLGRDGFRVVANSGKQAGQAVPHLHFHVLAGRQMHWPPG